MKAENGIDLESSAHETMEAELIARKEETTPAAIKEITPPLSTIKEKRQTVSLHVANASAAEVLRGLAEMTKQNVVFAGQLKEKVTANLDGVTPEEAMEAVMASCGLSGRKAGSTLLIFSSAIEKEAGIGAKSIRLSYASAKEVAEGLEHMVTKGKVSYKVAAKAKKAGVSVTAKGVVKVKKGTAKGTYKVTVTSKATSQYKANTKTFKVKVK